MPNVEAPSAVSPGEAAYLLADLIDAPALVIAVSGGPDSTALLLLAARWRAARRRGPTLLAVTVDHGLRPESAKEAAAVRRLAARLGVPHRTLRWTGEKPATGVQSAARAERYRLLAAAARKSGAHHILTAHTRDDQAETILFRLARGSGLSGLAGMARITLLDELFLVRPLIDVPKARLVATLREAGIGFAEDPSNADPRFARPRLRRLMPSLAAEGLTAGRLAMLGRRAARADAAIEAAVDEAHAHLTPDPWSAADPIAFDAEGFARLPGEVALRLMGRAIAFEGDEGPVELRKLEALVEDLVHRLDGREQAARFRRTLAGAMVTLQGGRIAVERAPARRSRGAKARKGAFTKRR